MTLGQETTKYATDVVAGGVTLGALVEFLPPAVTVLTGIWVCIRIWQEPTVQKWVKKWRKRHGR